MRICYVAMPYGVRRRADGNPQDFDFFFENGILPAVKRLDLECRRFDDFGASAFWQKSMFTGIISSDVMIADISTQNPNVLYELGVRHALKRGRTILISASGEAAPSNIGYAQILFYDLDAGGRPSEQAIARFSDELGSMLRQSFRTVISDSPIYEFFPELQTILPPELEETGGSRKKPSLRSGERSSKRSFAQAAIESPGKLVDDLKKDAQAVRGPDSDPIEFLTLLRRFRDLSQWDSVIALAQDAPPSIAQSPEVRQICALALNRRGDSGDQQRAISLMEGLIAETGGDGETFGILGRIYKDRYDEAKNNDKPADADVNLERALHYYRAGFEKNPNDIYPGVNVVTLLQQRGDIAALAELATIVPRVRAVVQGRIGAGRESGRVDYWDVATELQLAVVVRDWAAADSAMTEAVQLAGQQATAGWMVATTLRDLKMVGERWTDPEDRRRLAQLIDRLQAAQKASEAV